MRMIAEILECPFQLTILAESGSVERAAVIETAEPTNQELEKLAKAKARKDRRAKEAEQARLADAMEQIPSEKEELAEKEMTLGDYMDIHEELKKQETGRLPFVAEEVREASEAVEQEEAAYEAPAKEESVSGAEAAEQSGSFADILAREEAPEEPETDVQEVLRELEEMERETYTGSFRSQTEASEPHKEEKKAGGWRAMFQRRRKDRQELSAASDTESQHKAADIQEAESYGVPEAYAEPVNNAETEAYAEPESDTEPGLYTDREDYIDSELYQGQENDAESQMYGTSEYENDFIEYEQHEEEPEMAEAAAEEVLAETADVSEEDEDAEDLTRGELNPYTGHEYESNSVRMHPKRIGYVQVYDRRDHAWTDMTEWAFLGYQERKKALLGRDYEPPIYLD